MPGSALDVVLTNFTLWHSREVRLDIGASEEQRRGWEGGRGRGAGRMELGLQVLHACHFFR